MPEPREMALEVVRKGVREQVELMVALQYLGMLKDDALAPLRETDDIVARILSVPPAPEPDYAKRQLTIRDVDAMSREVARAIPPRVPPGVVRRRSRPDPSLLDAEQNRGRARHRVGGHEQSLFSQWVDGKIGWSPAVMGWGDNDSRAEGWQDGRFDE